MIGGGGRFGRTVHPLVFQPGKKGDSALHYILHRGASRGHGGAGMHLGHADAVRAHPGKHAADRESPQCQIYRLQRQIQHLYGEPQYNLYSPIEFQKFKIPFQIPWTTFKFLATLKAVKPLFRFIFVFPIQQFIDLRIILQK